MLTPTLIFFPYIWYILRHLGTIWILHLKTKTYSTIDTQNLWFNTFCTLEGRLDLSEKCCNSDMCMISMQSTQAKFRQVVRSTPLASKDMCCCGCLQIWIFFQTNHGCHHDPTSESIHCLSYRDVNSLTCFPAEFALIRLLEKTR